MNILLVEDETRVADFIRRGLKGEGWTVAHVPDGEQALEMLALETFDVVILDLMLPGISGQDVCRKMRARRNFTPVLMLTALQAEDERVKGLEVGADDYLPKPFGFDELTARIKALHRRQNAYAATLEDPVLKLGDICFDKGALSVHVGGEALNLTTKEREMLRLLMSSPNKVLSRERILSTVWRVNEDPMTNVVDVYIGRLRKKLGTCGAEIKTVRGIGYRIVESPPEGSCG